MGQFVDRVDLEFGQREGSDLASRLRLLIR